MINQVKKKDGKTKKRGGKEGKKKVRKSFSCLVFSRFRGVSLFIS